MKTSNKILTTLFALSILWMIAAFFTAKSRVIAAIKDNPSYAKNKMETKNKSLTIENFSNIEIEGRGTLIIKQAKHPLITSSNFTFLNKSIQNDTLYLSIEKGTYTLSVQKLKSIIIKKYANIQFSKFEADSIQINCSDYSLLKIEKLKFKFLKMRIEDKAKVHLSSLLGNQSIAKLSVLNHSELSLGKTKSIELQLKKSSNAKLISY